MSTTDLTVAHYTPAILLVQRCSFLFGNCDSSSAGYYDGPPNVAYFPFDQLTQSLAYRVGGPWGDSPAGVNLVALLVFRDQATAIRI